MAMRRFGELGTADGMKPPIRGSPSHRPEILFRHVEEFQGWIAAE